LRIFAIFLSPVFSCPVARAHANTYGILISRGLLSYPFFFSIVSYWHRAVSGRWIERWRD